MKIAYFLIGLLFFTNISLAAEEITPYKFTDADIEMPVYDIPASSIYNIKRDGQNAPDIIYYFSKPKAENYPIAILCGGSTSKETITSIIHFHRYFLQEFLDLGAGVITVEQWGIAGQKVNTEEFMAHYTRTQRLSDHSAVIEHLKENPPNGWNGKLIFLGVSEGGPIVTSLTTMYSEITAATINWSGAGDWSWREELWLFLQELLAENPECQHHLKLKDCDICMVDLNSRDHYDARIDAIALNPTPDSYFLNMTHKYHADALLYPYPDYEKIRTPFLVVAGVQDSLIQSSDAFVQKARSAGVHITYFRVEDMDHYVRKRPDIIEQSFKWLHRQPNLFPALSR